jgi:hypothetical protein
MNDRSGEAVKTLRQQSDVNPLSLVFTEVTIQTRFKRHFPLLGIVDTFILKR